MTSQVETLIIENSYPKDENRDFREDLLKLEYQELQNNLMFDGNDEQRNDADKECYSKIKRAWFYLCEDDPDEDGPTATNKASSVVINPICGYGTYVTKRKRPKIVIFQWYGDRD